MVDWNQESKRYQKRQKTTQAPNPTRRRAKPQANKSETRAKAPSRPRPQRNQSSPRMSKQPASASDRLRAQLDALNQSEQSKRRHAQKRQRAQSYSTQAKNTSKPRQGKPVRKNQTRNSRHNNQHKPVATQPPRVFSGQMFGYLMLFLALSVGFGLWVSPLSRLSSLAVSGNQLVSAETVLKDSGLNDQMSILDAMTSTNAVNQSLQGKHSNIKNATLQRDGREVTIQVQEYQPVAKVYVNGKLYPVFENQKVLSIDAKKHFDRLPLLETFENGQVERLAEALPKVPDDVRQKIKRITNIEDETHPDRIALEMSDGNIVVSSITDFAEKLNYYPSIIKELKDESGLIDMEVGIYFEPLTPLNNPYATNEEKEAYQKQNTPPEPEEEATTEETAFSETSAVQSDVQSSSDTADINTETPMSATEDTTDRNNQVSSEQEMAETANNLP